jgi:ABC-2 type transport system permease protein
VNLAVARLDLGQRGRGLFFWSLGFAAYVLVVVVLYPSFKDSASLDDFVTESPGLAAAFGITGSLTDPAGWLNANIYANFLPLVLLLVGIGYGAMAIAGQEERGTLALVQVLPIARRRVLVEKIVVLVVQVAVVGAVCFVSCLVGRAFELDVPVADLAWTSAAAVLLAVDFGLVALAAGAFTGERAQALGIAGGAAALFYLVASLAPVVDAFDAIKWTSLWYWSVSDGQLSTGVSVADITVLVVVGVVLAASAVVCYDRHDIHG